MVRAISGQDVVVKAFSRGRLERAWTYSVVTAQGPVLLGASTRVTDCDVDEDPHIGDIPWQDFNLYFDDDDKFTIKAVAAPYTLGGSCVKYPSVYIQLEYAIDYCDSN